MTLVQLVHFVTVAKAGSFSAAARALDVAQSAVSQSIAALERDLDAKLLDRTSRTCRLTALGEQFLADAQRIVRDAEDTRQRIRRAGRSGEARLVLGLTGGLSGLLTEKLLAFVKSQAPGLDLAIVEGSVARLRELLLEHRIDSAITYDIADDDAQVRGRFVAFEPMHLVAHPEVIAQLLRPGPVDLQQVARFPLFLPSLLREEGAGRLLMREAEKAAVPLDIRYELQSTSLMRRLLVQDKLATVIGLGSIADEVAAGELQSRVVEQAAFTRGVYLATEASRQPGPTDAHLLQGVQRIAAQFLLPCGLWRSRRGDYAPPDFAMFSRLR